MLFPRTARRFAPALTLVSVLSCVLASCGGGGAKAASDSAAATGSNAPVANKDHWHVAYGIYACDHFVKAIQNANDDVGIHTHGDGIIHVHPFYDKAAGRNATVGVFADSVGLTITDTSISSSEFGDLKASAGCGGAGAVVQAAVWSSPEATTPTVVTSDLRSIRFTQDRMVITFAVAAKGAALPKPPSLATLDQLTDVVPKNAAAITSPPAGRTITGATPCPAADGSSPRTTKFSQAPPDCLTAGKTYEAVVVTGKGSFTIALDSAAAPKTVNNFVVLARYHYFDGVAFHRIIPGFVVQGGDAVGVPPGSGDPGYSIADELPKTAYEIGSVAMANRGANTNGSQFFIVTGADGASLRPNYSKFGKVTAGLDVISALDKIGTAQGTPTESVAITSVTITEK